MSDQSPRLNAAMRRIVTMILQTARRTIDEALARHNREINPHPQYRLTVRTDDNMASGQPTIIVVPDGSLTYPSPNTARLTGGGGGVQVTESSQVPVPNGFFNVNAARITFYNSVLANRTGEEAFDGVEVTPGIQVNDGNTGNVATEIIFPAGSVTFPDPENLPNTVEISGLGIEVRNDDGDPGEIVNILEVPTSSLSFPEPGVAKLSGFSIEVRNDDGDPGEIVNILEVPTSSLSFPEPGVAKLSGFGIEVRNDDGDPGEIVNILEVPTSSLSFPEPGVAALQFIALGGISLDWSEDGTVRYQSPVDLVFEIVASSISGGTLFWTINGLAANQPFTLETGDILTGTLVSSTSGGTVALRKVG